MLGWHWHHMLPIDWSVNDLYWQYCTLALSPCTRDLMYRPNVRTAQWAGVQGKGRAGDTGEHDCEGLALAFVKHFSEV